MLSKDEILATIHQLVDKQQLEPATELLREYRCLFPKEIEAISIEAVIALMKGEIGNADAVIEEGLGINPQSFDLLFNKAYLLECQGDFVAAEKLYDKLASCADEENKEVVAAAQLRIKTELTAKNNIPKQKLAIFVKPQMDSFLHDVVTILSESFEVKKCQPQQMGEIDKLMGWADICWFEWCDELINYASRRPIAAKKTIVCRLHSYEAFTDYPAQVKWDNVDCLILVAEHIRDFVVSQYAVPRDKTVVIPNGIDLEKFHFKKCQPGFNIAYVGYINYKKGPMLLIHAFKAIYDKDNRYKLYIAGQFQDHRDVLYFQQMTKEFGIENNVIFTGWQSDLDHWMEDKNYILCTSVLESQNISVMQAMAKGIKPLVHNFVGARGIYDSSYLWNSIDEAVAMLFNSEYDSKRYRKFVEDYYDKRNVLQTLNNTVCELQKKNRNSLKENQHSQRQPIVTVGITVYNARKYLERCIKSVIGQNYPHIEILLIDNCSTDGSQDIIRKYEKKHKNIKGIFHEVNSGGPVQGIKEIPKLGSGKYYQWLCCDDCLEPDAVSRFVEYLESHIDIDYVYSDLNIIDELGNKTGEWNYVVHTPEYIVRHIFETGSGVIPMFGMQRKSFLEKNNIEWIMPENDVNDFSADTLTQLHFLRYGWKYGKVDKPVINYRIHGENDSHNIKKRIKASIIIYEYIIAHFSVEIFLAEIDWNKVNNAGQYKALSIAKFYLLLFNGYISGQAVPAHLRLKITEKELANYCGIYLQQGLRYIKAGLQEGKTYHQNLCDLQQQYELNIARLHALY
ncbi:MAG: glycosyltransferase [Pelosinus sp.]|nr:glycosyltransferase [Pelosinus sp.]